MADKVDSITLEIEVTTQKADKGIDKTIESLKAMKTALNGINTKKLRQEMESFEDFQKKLQTAFSNIKVSGNPEELRKQIAQVEARLDALTKKENKLKTVSGINENSKQYRNLVYDIAEAKSALERLPMSQLIGMHEAYRIARNSGYIKDQAVSYATMAAIVAEAYKQGYEKAEADKKPHS